MPVFALLTWAAALSGGFAQLAAVSAVARLLFSASGLVVYAAMAWGSRKS